MLECVLEYLERGLAAFEGPRNPSQTLSQQVFRESCPRVNPAIAGTWRVAG